MTTIEYKSPELTAEDTAKAEANAKLLIRKWGFGNLPKMLAALCVENVRLTKEIQEHRAARGIEPLKTFEL